MILTTETFYDANQKIWSGPKKPSKYGPNTTIGEVVLDTLSRNAEKVMQIWDTTGEEKTGAQLLNDSKIIAQYLLSQGLKPGDVVGLYARNTTNLTAVIIASALCGTPWNAAFPGFDKENIILIYKITTPKIVFCDIENYETMKEAIKELGLDAKIITVNGVLKGVDSVMQILTDTKQNFDNIRFPCFDLNGDSTAAIQCSSGTTGSPKGVTCSNRALLESPVYLNNASNDVIFCFSTFYWISATFALSKSLFYGARRIITDKPFTPQYFYYLVEKYGITHLLCPTEQVAMLAQNADPDARKRLRSVKVIMTGGAKVHETVAKNFAKNLDNENKLIIAYGQSEIGAMLSETSLGTKTSRYDCEGKLMPNIEARIIDQNTGEALGPNAPGQLHIRTPYKWGGYYRNPEATEKTYINGWINSGDIAYFDDDGFLHFCARDSDIFKCNGFHVYPQKIENLIIQVPGVAEVCVFGEPDLGAGKVPACAIVRTNDEAGTTLTKNIILNHVEKHLLELYHIKGGVYFVDMLPKTASGKVQRRKVCNMVNNNDQSCGSF